MSDSNSYNFSPPTQKLTTGGVQTLSQRKAAIQKKPTGQLAGVKQQPNGTWEYEEDALNDKLRSSKSIIPCSIINSPWLRSKRSLQGRSGRRRSDE